MKTRNGAYQRLKLLSAPLSLDENTEQYLPKNAISAHSLRAYIFSNIRSVLLCYGQVWFIMSEGPEVLEKKGYLSPIPPDLSGQSSLFQPVQGADFAYHLNICPPLRILIFTTGSNMV